MNWVSEGEDHTLLPQCRTVGTVWGLGLNPCGEPLGACGEGDGSKGESGRGVPSTSLDPPRHRPPEECVRVSEEDLGLGLRGRGKRRTRHTHLSYLLLKNGPGFRGGAEY